MLSQEIGIRFKITEYQIQSASNAIKALEIIDTWRPDLVVTDQSMPGMTGIELIKNLRKDKGGTQIQIILCSSHLTDDLIAEAEALGAACIAKPFNLGELINLTGNYLK